MEKLDRQLFEYAVNHPLYKSFLFYKTALVIPGATVNILEYSTRNSRSGAIVRFSFNWRNFIPTSSDFTYKFSIDRFQMPFTDGNDLLDISQYAGQDLEYFKYFNQTSHPIVYEYTNTGLINAFPEIRLQGFYLDNISASKNE